MTEEELIARARRDVVDFGRRLYERRLVAGRGGNLSVRLPNGNVLITSHGRMLGALEPSDLLEITLDGHVVGGQGHPSSEAHLHLTAYRKLGCRAVVHSHPVHATALTLRVKNLRPPTFETQLALGTVSVISQDSPTVLDAEAVVEALGLCHAVLLERHGAVTVGESLEDAFVLTELLEEAAEIVVIGAAVSVRETRPDEVAAEESAPAPVPVEARVPMFSQEHIGRVCELVNEDEQATKRGQATKLTTRLGIRNDDIGVLFNIHLVDGKVSLLDHDETVDYLISGPDAVWRLVFGGKIDPFVAVTQRRLKLRGDMGKLSRWYAPFRRVFDLWKQVPFQ